MSEDDVYASLQGFEILSDETRVDILRVLAEHLKENSDDPALGFSDLRRAVGMRDSGNFNYHLDHLVGRFVRSTDDGYRIAPAGLEVIAALVAGTYGEGDRLGPVEIGDPCPVCDEPLTAIYEHNILSVTCPDDHVFQNTLPPGAIDGRSIDDVIELLTLTTKQHLELAVHGICPLCQGQLDWGVRTIDREPLEFTNQCDRCGVRVDVPAIACVLHHPAVVSFYYEHGIDIRDRPLWAPEFYNNVRLDVTSDPVEVEITIEFDGDGLTVILDEGLDIKTLTA